MIEGRQIVCLSWLRWDFLRTSRYHLARILAGTNEVLFVDPPRHLWQAGTPGERLHDEGGGILRLEPPPHLPFAGSLRFHLTTWWNQRSYAESVECAVRQLGWKRPVLWNTCPVYYSPLVAPRIDPSVHFLHLTDSLWDYPWFRPEYETFLRKILRSADFAVGCTPEIAERLRGYGVEAHHVAHGVDVGIFEPVARGKVTPAPAMEHRARPRIGFVGKAERRFDVDAVCAMAAGRGSVTILGPRRLPWRDMCRLSRAGCVFEDEVPYEQVPSWLAGFDIAVVPYLRSGIVEPSRPLKLLEYMAAGLPVVSVDIPAARELAPHVMTANGPAEFARLVDRIWGERGRLIEDPAVRLERVERVRSESWTRRAEELSTLIESTGKAKRAQIGDRVSSRTGSRG
ncbi:MAG: glycosyltransferase [Actinomycetota bacterium]